MCHAILIGYSKFSLSQQPAEKRQKTCLLVHQRHLLTPKGQFRVFGQPNVPYIGLWEETGVPSDGENLQSPHTNPPSLESNP